MCGCGEDSCQECGMHNSAERQKVKDIEGMDYTVIKKGTTSKQTTSGMPGWCCPRCGRGCSPYTSYCPCVPMPQMKVTCAT